jgi:hypothetical protein
MLQVVFMMESKASFMDSTPCIPFPFAPGLQYGHERYNKGGQHHGKGHLTLPGSDCRAQEWQS